VLSGHEEEVGWCMGMARLELDNKGSGLGSQRDGANGGDEKLVGKAKMRCM
jgi:hypothetical protein